MAVTNNHSGVVLLAWLVFIPYAAIMIWIVANLDFSCSGGLEDGGEVKCDPPDRSFIVAVEPIDTATNAGKARVALQAFEITWGTEDEATYTHEEKDELIGGRNSWIAGEVRGMTDAQLDEEAAHICAELDAAAPGEQYNDAMSMGRGALFTKVTWIAGVAPAYCPSHNVMVNELAEDVLHRSISTR